MKKDQACRDSLREPLNGYFIKKVPKCQLLHPNDVKEPNTCLGRSRVNGVQEPLLTYT